jgi:pilus assembly protein CpaF
VAQLSLAELVNEASDSRPTCKWTGELDSVSQREAYSVKSLREDLERVLSLENIARDISQNPKLAKNEIECACRQIFAHAPYLQLSSSQKEKLLCNLLDSIFGFGPIENLLNDESVTEIMINGHNNIWIERFGRLEKCELTFGSDEDVMVFIDRIVGPLGRRVDESSPYVNARMPQGHRVNAIIPPIALGGPHVTIRAFARSVMSLDDLERNGSIEEEVRVFLSWLVKLRKNVVVSGGTGSGKTTLLNAISTLIDKNERIITIEDAAELKFDRNLHVVRLEARPVNAEGTGEITIRELVANALRMRPDRIIVGECRGGEALDMLQAMNTGHDGSLTTIHANSTADVIERMITLVRYAVDLPIDAIKALLGSAFDYILHIQRSRETGGRFISEISEVSFDREKSGLSVRCIYSREDIEDFGKWTFAPSFLNELPKYSFVKGGEVLEWRQSVCL